MQDKNAQEQDNLSLETLFSEIQSIHEMLNQRLAMQKESQKQAATLVAGPIIKEDKWLDATIALAVDKAFKVNSDALWANFKEETVKNEKLMKECMNKIEKMTTVLVNKQVQSMAEKIVKEITHTITTTLEEILSSSLMETFQAGVVDKMENQLEKSVNAKLIATAARQMQAQFPTSGKQPLEAIDSLKDDKESDSSVSVITQQDKNAQDNVSLETIFAELQSIDEMLNQHLQKQAATLVIDDKWLEEKIALAVHKAFEANSEALLVRFQEKNEKVMKECVNKIKEMTTGLVNKVQSMTEKTAKEVAHTITTTLEELLYSSLMEAFQELEIKCRIKRAMKVFEMGKNSQASASPFSPSDYQ